MPNAAPQVAHAIGASGAGAFDVGSACTGFIAALAAARGMLASRRVAPCARDRRRDHVPPRRPRRPQHRRAVRRRRRRGRAAAPAPPATLGPVVLGADGVARRPDRRRPGDARCCAMDGHETFKQAVRRLAQATRDACDAARRRDRRRRPLRLPPGQHADPRLARRAPRARPGARRRRDRRRSATPRPRACRSRSPRRATRGGSRRACASLLAAAGLGLHLGRDRRRMGARVSRAGGRLRAGHRRLARHRRGDLPRARRRRLAGRGQLPHGRRAGGAASSPRSRPPAGAPSALAGRRRAIPATAQALLDGAARGARRPGPRARQQRRRARRRPRAVAHRRGLASSCSTPTSARPTG